MVIPKKNYSFFSTGRKGKIAADQRILHLGKRLLIQFEFEILWDLQVQKSNRQLDVY